MRQTTIFTLLVAAIMSVAVFYLKYEVTDLETELDRLNRNIVADREAIHVLEAEWSHLNQAERIRALAEKYLEMDQTRPDQITQPDALPRLASGELHPPVVRTGAAEIVTGQRVR